jgi:hypothetical protein
MPLVYHWIQILFLAFLIFKIDFQNFEKLEKKKGSQTLFFETLIISLKIVELIVSVIIFIVVNPTFWHNVYLVSMCSLIKSIALLVGFERLFFACIH